MKTSEFIDKISEALSLAQGEIGTVAFNKINPHFKSRYADLSAILAACRGPLSKHGLALLQPPSFVDGRVVILTRLVHKSGQWFESDLSFRPKDDTPQSIGSTISYGKRYSASAMLAIATDEDDDGNGAQQHDTKGNSQGRHLGVAPQAEAPVRGTADRPSSSARKDYVTSESAPSADAPVGFNPDNKYHIERMSKTLDERKIPEKAWGSIFAMMRGKTRDDLDEVLFELASREAL